MHSMLSIPKDITKKVFLQTCSTKSWGGLEFVAFEHAIYLKNKGFESLVACPKDSPLDKKSRDNKIKTIDIKCPLTFRKSIKALGVTDIVVHYLKDLSFIVPSLLGLSEVRIIGFSHTFLAYYKRDPLHNWYYANVEKLVVFTPPHKDNLLKYLNIKEAQMVTIPNGVDTGRFHPSKKSKSVREKYLVKDSELLVGLIGRLDMGKGQLETVAAAKILKDKNIPFKILIVGEDTVNNPGTMALVKKKLAQLGLEKDVILTGFVENPETIMASIDLFLMPSYAETFGRVLIEAMASDVASIGTDAGGVPAIINHMETGYLIEPRSAESLANAIEFLYKNPDVRLKLAKAGRQKAEAIYSFEKVYAQLDALFGI